MSVVSGRAEHPGGGSGRAAGLPPRAGADACPGTLRPHGAADGGLVRLRPSGGKLTPGVLEGVMGLARRHGSPLVQLTSRGNLQLRGLPDPLPADLLDGVEELGLLPSRTHERARNVLAVADDAAQDLASRLDAAVRAEPGLADLPARFLTVVTDASGQLLGERWDLALQVVQGRGDLAGRATVRVLVAPDHAVAGALPVGEAVREVVRLMLAFLRLRPDERTWNVRDLPSPLALRPDLVPAGLRPPAPLAPGDRPSPGRLVVGVPLGMLRPEHTAALRRVAGDRGLVLTPWRSLVVDLGATVAASPELPSAPDVLRAAGLVVAPGTAWGRLTACVGAPHCGRTSSPTLDLAARAAPRLGPDGPRVHVVGCGRACGRPSGDHVLVVDPTRPDQVVQESR